MLLNPSHEITNCGLPDHIQTRYIRYKQGNRAIVAWMTKYGPNNYKGRKTLPIKQLVALGNHLCEQVHEIDALPPDVDYHFREVIRERVYLSQHYRSYRDCCEQDKTDTINHEHFTDSLRKVHRILLSAKETRRSVKPKCRARRRSSVSLANSTESRFTQLSIDSDDSDSNSHAGDTVPTFGTTSTETDDTSDSESSRFQIRPTKCARFESDKNEDFLDSEGGLAVAIEAGLLLNNLQIMAKSVEKYWMRAGSGDMHIGTATALTNIVISKAVDQLNQFNDNAGVRATIESLRAYLKNLSCQADHEHAREREEVPPILDALGHICTALSGGFTDRHETPNVGAKGWSFSVDFVESNHEGMVKMMIRSLSEVLRIRSQSTVTYNSTPAADTFVQLSLTTGDDTNILRASIVLYYLCISHCSFLSVIRDPRQVLTPRLSALRLAKEASKSVGNFLNDKSIFPCQCVNTLGHRVAQMQQDLDAFAKVNCWNTFMQCPVVAGNQILELLDLCCYYGMHLFHYRQYVAAVLHTYHALREVGTIDELPILEELCSTLSTVLYPMSVRPTSGFVASWLRYVGARLRFKSGGRNLNHKDTWCMSIPAHTAARSAGLNIDERDESSTIPSKVDYGNIDPIVKLKRDCWVLEEQENNELNKVWSSKLPRQTKRKRIQSHLADSRTKSEVDSNNAHEACPELGHRLNAALVCDGDLMRQLPTSRINLLALFHSMTRVVSAISDETHAIDDTEIARSLTSPQVKDNGKGQMCLCFVQTIIRGADRIQESRKRIGLDARGACWTKNEKNCIDCFKTHLATELDRAGVSAGQGGSWLWTSI